ncbi:Protein penguin [Melipona quadrifasciata]|uniref:Protein penguin n=1 Tax=Melipona quadrifasciata TaxID=166423 RepID=A0A0M9A2I2_9HYME|nr:Protein penguin [Melipona quadrifasciata]
MAKRKLKSNEFVLTNPKKPSKKNKTENNNNIKENKDNKSEIKRTAKEKYAKILTKDSKENHNINMKEKLTIVNNNSMEKPNWLEFKKKKKELKEKRLAKRFSNIYDLSIAVKQLGEKLRRSDCSKLERKKLILKAHDLIKTNYNRIIFTHDMSRIVQWILKYCDAEIRQVIFEELKPSLLSMIESKYAKNCIKTLLKYGSQGIRQEIISSCYGNVVKFMSHSVSAPLLELMYSTWATEIEKRYFKQEFYGDMYKQAKDKQIKTLSDVYITAKDMKAATLSAIKGNLMRILNKKFLNSILVHSVLLEFLNNCSVEDRTEIITMLKSSLVELSQTKFGSKVAVLCIWHGTNKDRKIIIKSLKGNIKNISMSEHGYLILLALFDSVDDTVLIKKIIFPEIQDDLTDIALNDYGKHVILYLVARRNSHYFAPSIVKYLEQGDNNATSKKSSQVREKELLDSISDSLLQSVITNTPIWMTNGSIAMVTLAILKTEEWIECNRGCFLLVLLLENETLSIVNTMVSKLKLMKNILELKSNPGAKILLKKLK